MENFSIDSLDDFTRAYMECALWSSTFEDDDGNIVTMDENFNIHFLAPVTRENMIADCKAFQEKYETVLQAAYDLDLKQDYYTADNAGHDFWLSRNGHGAGFWDRGLGDIGEALTKACGWKTNYPEVDLYIGDDGLIYA